MSRGSLADRADFRALVDHLEGVAVWIASDPREFEYLSDGFEDIWGIPADAVEDDPQRMVEGVHPEDRERVISIMQRPEAELSEEVVEHRVVRPDGEVRWVQARVFPLDVHAGGPVVGVTTDITDQKRRQDELESLNRIVRHDIRNDMSVILGWAELLEAHVDEEGEEYAEKVLLAGEHVVELTEIARDYLETITAGGQLDLEPVALQPTLERELSLRRDGYPEAEFVVTEECTEVDVLANELLASVFRNLLHNAVQHNDAEEPHVEIACTVEDATVRVAVADNGPGIPEDRRESVFGKGEVGLESAGTGIGLYLVRRLVGQFDGRIWIEDNEPRGSVFVVELRRA